jgi:hypothetical protein
MLRVISGMEMETNKDKKKLLVSVVANSLTAMEKVELSTLCSAKRRVRRGI